MLEVLFPVLAVSEMVSRAIVKRTGLFESVETTFFLAVYEEKTWVRCLVTGFASVAAASKKLREKNTRTQNSAQEEGTSECKGAT